MTARLAMPSVTTVIPAFNAERFLGEAIESALAQDYEPHEVIVVDDGSTDRTAEIARGYERVRLIEQENQGPAGARNTAIEAAEGEAIALLDSDDLMAPGRLRTQVGYLLEHPEAGAVLGMHELLVEPGVKAPAWIGNRTYRSPEPHDDWDLPFNEAYDCATMVAWRRAFETVGGYDTAFEYGEDVDWLMRLMESGMTVGTIDEPVISRRMHGENMVYDRDAVRRSLFQAFKARIDRRRASGSATDPK